MKSKKKNILLIIISVLTFSIGFSQSISPYYPNYANSNERSQFTYYDMNFVTSKIENYLQFTKTLLDTKPNLKNGGGNIKVTYTDKISNNKNSEILSFDFKVFNIDNEFVVESCKISGSYNSVLDFYIGYWDTKISIDRSKKKFTLTNHHLQDNIEFSALNNVYIISITNSTIVNKELFINEFKSKKQKIEEKNIKKEIEKKEIENLKKIELEKKAKLEQDKKDSHKEIIQYYKINKRKKGFEYVSEFPNNELKAEIEKQLITSENGNYTIKYTSISELNIEIDHKIEVSKFEVTPFLKFVKLTPFGFLFI